MRRVPTNARLCLIPFALREKVAGEVLTRVALFIPPLPQMSYNIREATGHTGAK